MPYTTLLTPTDAQAHLDDPAWAFVDCRFSLTDTERGRRAYREAHIPGAVYAHLDADLSGPIVPGVTGRHPLPDVDAFARTLSAWGIAAGVQVVAYDDAGGGIAARLWWMLRWLGHDAVAVLDGGWPAWQRLGLPARSEDETRPPHRFMPHPHPALIADAGEVDARRTDPAYRLLDARGAERYQGINEPIDPVAGHIPGAVSVPFAGNLDADGTFLPAEMLQARFAALLGDVPPDRVICYCGSGVTACHDILAMTHAGLDTPRLYPGSWSEWIVDASRPRATGPDPQ
jgi:thiosulfate/3-mercaptopyruvate sulfurtransferase